MQRNLQNKEGSLNDTSKTSKGKYKRRKKKFDLTTIVAEKESNF